MPTTIRSQSHALHAVQAGTERTLPFRRKPHKHLPSPIQPVIEVPTDNALSWIVAAARNAAKNKGLI